jgi:hypothetical protein
MITKNLSRRLKLLEARLTRNSEPIIMEIQFVSPDKVVTDTLLIEIGAQVPDPGRAR